jgi:hypothetical protein
MCKFSEICQCKCISVCIFQPYTEKRCCEREKEGKKEESKKDLKGNEGERAGILPLLL